jgi:hypothetical protein
VAQAFLNISNAFGLFEFLSVVVWQAAAISRIFCIETVRADQDSRALPLPPETMRSVRRVAFHSPP